MLAGCRFAVFVLLSCGLVGIKRPSLCRTSCAVPCHALCVHILCIFVLLLTCSETLDGIEMVFLHLTLPKLIQFKMSHKLPVLAG